MTLLNKFSLNYLLKRRKKIQTISSWMLSNPIS